jgi:hypothetical protein
VHVILSTKLLPVGTVCANNRIADVHSTPDITQFAHVFFARLTLLMLQAFCNVLHEDVNSTEYESENVLLF